MIFTSESDDPLPTRLTRAYSFVVTKRFLSFMISTIIIVSCFLLVSYVRAQSEADILITGRSSLHITETLCGVDAQVRAQKHDSNREENAIARALCMAQNNKKRSTLFAQRLHTYVSGYPIEQMVDALVVQDPVVVAYMVAMAKQESNWGKRVPVLNGQDCYNYWGFRAKRARMGSGGHTCFDSPEDAVETVAKRVHELVYNYNRRTPRQMLIWKCGRSCASHDPVGVERWIAVISQYYTAVTALAKESDA